MSTHQSSLSDPWTTLQTPSPPSDRMSTPDLRGVPNLPDKSVTSGVVLPSTTNLQVNQSSQRIQGVRGDLIIDFEHMEFKLDDIVFHVDSNGCSVSSTRDGVPVCDTNRIPPPGFIVQSNNIFRISEIRIGSCNGIVTHVLSPASGHGQKRRVARHHIVAVRRQPGMTAGMRGSDFRALSGRTWYTQDIYKVSIRAVWVRNWHRVYLVHLHDGTPEIIVSESMLIFDRFRYW